MSTPTDRRPNLFVVGVQKAGTSALAAWLGRHPQVFVSFPKEPGFLAFGEQGYIFSDGYGRRAPASDWVVTSEAEYLSLFADAAGHHKVLSDASTWYFALPGMARRLDEYSPGCKAIVVLRNPVDRAYSAWSHARRDGLEPCDDFSDALAQETARGEVEYLLRYRQMGLYSESLAEYQEVFGVDRLMVLMYEDLSGDRDKLWLQLCRFLDLDASSGAPAQRTVNKSGEPRSKIVQDVLGSYHTRVWARKLLPRALGFKVKEILDRLNLKPMPGPDPNTKRMLHEYYRDDIMAVANQCGRNLAHWLD